MFQRFAAILAVPILAVSLFGQGIDTQATKDDWEEINFRLQFVGSGRRVP